MTIEKVRTTIRTQPAERSCHEPCYPAADLKLYIIHKLKWFEKTSRQMDKSRGITSLTGSGFVSHERFLLRYGQWFKTDERTSSGRRMTPKQCYCNSAERALKDPTLRYCEGYCYGCDHFLFVHAWLIDERGMVVDPTLRETPLAYFGVRFKTEYLMQTMERTGLYGIFIPQNQEVYSLDDAQLASVIDPVLLSLGSTIKGTSRKGRRPRCA
jgi:hypothetical protein